MVEGKISPLQVDKLKLMNLLLGRFSTRCEILFCARGVPPWKLGFVKSYFLTCLPGPNIPDEMKWDLHRLKWVVAILASS